MKLLENVTMYVQAEKPFANVYRARTVQELVEISEGLSRKPMVTLT